MSTVSHVVLHGSNLVLRSLSEQDLRPLWTLIYGEETPEWKKWDAPYFPFHRLTYAEYQEKMRKSLDDMQRPLDRLIIEVDEHVIGTVGFYWESKDTRWLEVGIDIYNPSYWSGGVGTEALRVYIDYLFEELPEIARVGLTTWSGNVRMVRCAEKLGMRMEGRMRKCRYYNGVYYDSIRMGILREEWENRNTFGMPV